MIGGAAAHRPLSCGHGRIARPPAHALVAASEASQPDLYTRATMANTPYRVGVVGVSGYGGGEILRLLARHPSVQVVYAAGESSAGRSVAEFFPSLSGPVADLTIAAFRPTDLPELDL